MSTARITTDLEQQKKQFNLAVHQFKQRHGKKLKEIFTNINYHAPYEDQVLNNFFNNSDIYTYLTRDANLVNFSENNPALTDANTKEAKEKSDHYELKIYKLLSYFFMFRKDALSSDFYKLGTLTTPNSHNYFYFEDIQKKYNYNNDELYIELPTDIYRIRTRIDKCSQHNSQQQPTFLITPNWKDNHATTLLHILEKNSGRLLTSVFINSVPDDGRYYNCKRMDLSFNNTTRITTFIEASHYFQTEAEDGNCTLYNYNFSLAIAEMLKNPAIREKVYQLAKNIDQKSRSADFSEKMISLFENIIGTDAQSQLVHIFKEELKPFLPCYYNSDNNPRPYADIKKFHLMQRWNIDSRQIALNFSSPEQEETKNTFSPTR